MRISLIPICNCHSCGCDLGYNPGYINIYSGGPFYCGNCGANVTRDIYFEKIKPLDALKLYINQAIDSGKYIGLNNWAKQNKYTLTYL